ncbi:hypothetical protein CATYP_04280 [Corynebacterium atypicum]|uniref:HTH cro/C1-type domain-containing protein n=2 Tax=Corynebacterium atypicum TaxID=191610 RepID=A0ABN4DC71_9CORY|nr:hypothetical protein CATYP_04280 [Corynebacterium atypicum]
MATHTALMTSAPATLPASASTHRRQPEPLLRAALGDALRGFRAERRITLRELAETARVSPGYLSEIERGRKEASSELIAAICHALGVTVADLLIEAAGTMAIGQAVADELAGLPS